MALAIAGNARANLKALWLFTVLWNTVSVPILYYVPPELHRNPVAAIGFVFPLAGAGMIAWCMLSTLRTRRFGDVWLEPTGGDATPGSTWTARVHARLPQPDAGAYTIIVRLTCLQRTVSRSGDDRNDQERIVWREEVDVASSQIDFGGDDVSIPVRFDIPADARETTVVGKGGGILWVLTAEAALPGVNLKEDFDVPVRAGMSAGRTEGLQPLAGLQPYADPQPRARGVSLDDLAQTGITIEPSPDGMRYRFAPMRNVGFAIGVTVFAALFAGATWLQWFLGFPWIFPILTALVDLLLVYIAVDVWLGVTVVVAGHGTLCVRHAVLGGGAPRRLAATDVAGIGLHISMQTQGRYGTPYYEIRATLKNGRTAPLGDGIRNKRHAEWLAAQMREALGLK